MSNCVRCGRTMDGIDVGGDGICSDCEAAGSGGHGSGTPTDVPCQRCGMYLPSHELQMWNSRLYCSYCIMDIKDEEKHAKGQERPPEGGAPPSSGGILGGLFGARDQDSSQQPPPGKGGGEPLQQYPGKTLGRCERCGRESDVLYAAQGLSVCPSCYFSGGATGASPSFFAQIVSTFKRTVGIREKPKIIEQAPQMVFDLRTRTMVEKAKEIPRQEEPEEQGKGDSPSPSPPLSSSIFDVRERKLVEKKEGMAAEEPISESAHSEKKPSPAAKKLFFKMHPSGGGAIKKKK